GHGLCFRLDASARPRAPARRRTAAGDFRSRRLGRLDRDHRRDRRRRGLGHPWPGRRAGALVQKQWIGGATARSRRLWRRGRERGAACTRGRGMNRFAELLDRLAYEPGRNNKLRLITGYFREVGDPDRGYALAALTGALSFKHAKPSLIRDLIAARTDPVLFGLSYDYVGDLSETVALMWPKGGVGHDQSFPGSPSPQPAPTSAFGEASADVGEGQGGGYRGGDANVALRTHNNPPPPTLTEVVTTLRTLGKTEMPAQLARWLDELDETGRWALLK